MRFTPYEYQTTAINWIMDRPRCGLFLDMGLGKTVITLTAIQRLLNYGEITKALVVAPKKVAETTWSTEADKWDHLSRLRVSRVMGTAAQRRKALAEDADIYVIGRDSFVWLCKEYPKGLPFDMLIIDELTSFKSPKAGRFKAMRIVSPMFSRVVGLTGTPAPNGLIDLWAQIYCLDMGERLGRSVTRYRDTYFDLHRWNNIVVRTTLRKGAAESIRRKIADICLSMQAKDYIQLPPMMTHKVLIDLPDQLAEDYRRFERDAVLELTRDNDEAQIPATSAAALLNKLSQFANGAIYDTEGASHHIHDEKLDRLVEIVEGAKNSGSGVLIFYQYRHDIPRIVERLESLGQRTAVYKDEGNLNEWNAGNIDALLAHPASTAFGLNMQQGGHYVVWFGTGWNLELYQQANARLHRQGQQHPVTVYQLLCRGTVDERASAALENKRGVQQTLLDELKHLILKHRDEKANKHICRPDNV